MHTRNALLFIGGVLASALAMQASRADAFTARYNALYCQAADSAVKPDYAGITSSSNTTSSAFLSCPVTDTDTMNKSAVTTINVYGFDATTVGSVSAAACILSYDNSHATACGTTSTSVSGSIGNYVLTPGLTAWQNGTYSNDYAYLYVVLPAQQGAGGKSTLRGFTISG